MYDEYDDEDDRKVTPFQGYDGNPYYYPENCNLEIVESTHRPDLCYEFDMVVLWKDKTTGEQFWAHDSGCSCPSPFEWVRSISDLNDLKFTRQEYEKAKAECANPRRYWGDDKDDDD